MNKSLILGASLGGFKGLTLEKGMAVYLKLSSEFDLNAVEIRFEKVRGRPSLWSWETNNNIVDFLDDFEVTGAHLPFVYLNPISPNHRIKEESLNQLKEGIEKASELDMNYCVMHARGFALESTYEQQLNVWKGIIKQLAEYAMDKSILLTIENADVLSNLNILASTVRGVTKGLKITLDVGHAHLRSVPPLSSYPVKELALRGLDAFTPFFIKKNMPYEEYGSVENFIKSEHALIANVHVHDYNGRNDHIGIGNGKIDFSFLSELKKNFTGPYIFEVEFENYHAEFKKSYRKFMELMRA